MPVTLKSPGFGSEFRVLSFINTRDYLAGAYQQVDSWDEKLVRLIRNRGMTKTDLELFITFVTTYRGVKITLTDEFGDDYDGYIVSRTISIDQNSQKAAGCADGNLYTIQFLFEGVFP